IGEHAIDERGRPRLAPGLPLLAQRTLWINAAAKIGFQYGICTHAMQELERFEPVRHRRARGPDIAPELLEPREPEQRAVRRGLERLTQRARKRVIKLEHLLHRVTGV